jgi:protein-S-isoprenylcysteine O-methyltransferase Ste14
MTNLTPLLKSILNNIGVAVVGVGIALLGTKMDTLLGVGDFRSTLAAVLGGLLFAAGFLIRVWATYYFYKHRMRVIALRPQQALVTSGPYRFSRNPLYLGGNVFIFFGAALLLGSPTAFLFTALHLPLMDLFIRREEKQLQQAFGEEWLRYKNQVRRWI